MVSQGFFSGSESAEKRRFAGEKENNANLSTRVEPVKLASLNYPTGDLTKPYAPDEVGDYIKDTEVKRPTYTDTSGNIYDKSPYKSLFSDDDDDDTPAKFLGRVGDDLNFSQPYNKRLGEDNFRKEQAGYLRSQGVDENTITRLSGDVPRTIGERTENFFKGLFPGFRDTSEALTRFDVKEMPNYQKEYYDKGYKDFRKDMRNKVFSESSYGEDVEGKPRYDKFGNEKPGYYYSDFQQPGVFRSEEDVKSYIKDRGAFLTGMPSNFEGGISGRGEKTDDLSSMYRSTAGDEKTRLQKAKEEGENKNILQKVGDAVGDVFNKLTGTLPAGADTLQGQGINTGATVNLSQVGNVSEMAGMFEFAQNFNQDLSIWNITDNLNLTITSGEILDGYMFAGSEMSNNMDYTKYPSKLNTAMSLEEFRTCAKNDAGERICGITLEPLYRKSTVQPPNETGNKSCYDRDAFIEWYKNNPSHPETRSRLDKPEYSSWRENNLNEMYGNNRLNNIVLDPEDDDQNYDIEDINIYDEIGGNKKKKYVKKRKGKQKTTRKISNKNSNRKTKTKKEKNKRKTSK